MKTVAAIISLFLVFSLYGERIGIIGGGGSGLTTAWLLEGDHEVTLFEKQDRLGGHANTVDVEVNGETVPIDAGFEFIAKKQFPHLFNLLRILNVPVNPFTLVSTYYKTDGSEVVILPPFHNGKIEWESVGDVFDLLQFSYVIEEGKRLVEIGDSGISFGDFVDGLHLTKGFKRDFLIPFLAAGWGVSAEQIRDFAAFDALKYVILGEQEKDYEWYEIVGGTSAYIRALRNQLKTAEIKLSARIERILYGPDGYVVVEEDGTATEFDHLVLATNAGDAGRLLNEIPEAEDIRSILGKVRYFRTTIAIHGDPRFMPPDSDDWRVVNIRYDGVNSANTVYKKWLSDTPIFKSWLTFDVRAPGDRGEPMPENLYALKTYDHPVADLIYFWVQKAVGMVQGNRNLWFAGNWTYDNDSHESAVMSAIRIGEELAPGSQRLALIKD